MSSTRFNPPVPALEQVTGDGRTTTPDTDGTLVPGENDYSSSKNKPTLRSYISSLTKGVPPSTGLGSGILEYNGPVEGLHANAFPVAADGEGQAKFSDQVGLDDTLSRDSLPGAPFDSTDVSTIVTTGPLGTGNDTVQLSGHELLPGVVGSEVRDGPVRTTSEGAKAYITSLGQALGKQNLQSGGLKVDGGESFSPREFSHDANELGPTTSQRVKLGDTFADTMTSRSYDVPNVERTSVGDLQRVAVEMMRKAIGDTGNPKDKVLAQQGKTIISSRSTRAAAVETLSGLNRTTAAGGDNELPSGEPITGGIYTTQSWPVLHNPDEPYTGFTSTVDAAAAAFVTSGTFIAAVIAISAVGTLIPGIAKGLIPAEVNTGSTGSSRKLKSGKFRLEETSSLIQGLQTGLEIASNVTGLTISNPIHIVTNPTTGYADCVIAGLASFLGVTYGIDPQLILKAPLGLAQLNGNTGVLLAEIAVRVAAIFVDPASRQYYMNIIRELNRDTIALGGNLSSLSGGGNLLAGAGNAIGAISSIFDSKLFKLVNTFAQIGDLAYTQAAAIDFRNTNIESDPLIAYSAGGQGTFNPLAQGSSQAKFMRGFGARRIYGDKLIGRRGVSYSLSDLPSYHLVPTGSTQSYRGLLGTSQIGQRITSVKPEGVDGRYRFSPEQVSSIESTLDAEYMPFYFQDLRTNEIIAFHAFLDDLTDSYTANYNSTSGYGRIEDVKSYKDTKRSVGCTFHIVGMNPQDFDYMWWQINKLTTMVYPQWSQGRNLTGQVNFADFNFTQPFSQVPTATPLIRFRVGDLIRSNYSRFNLKRLFGYQDVEKGQSKATEGKTYTVSPGEYQKKYTEKLLEFVKITTPTLVSNVSFNFGIDENEIEFLYPVTGEILVTDDPGNITEEIHSSDKNENASSFYDPKNNTIIKSFETTRGLGLAAVVTQLGFTWLDNTTLWGVGEDGPGNRAPRACKVQMSFEPIHDIAPGLDHEGFNRAPIYPVGGLVNSIVEGGEPDPYGVGTVARGIENINFKQDKMVYEEANKQPVFKKLF